MSSLDTGGVTVAVTTKPTDQQKTQTELEMEAERKAAERPTAQPVVPQRKTDGAAPSGETVDTSIGASLTAHLAEAGGVKHEVLQGERLPAPKSTDQGRVLQVAGAADPGAALAFLTDFFGIG